MNSDRGPMEAPSRTLLREETSTMRRRGVQPQLGWRQGTTDPFYEMPADVVVYRTPYCAYCFRARLLLEQKGVTFREIDVSRDLDLRRWLIETTGRRTVPQVFVNERPVGGYDELASLERQGKLDALLAEEPDQDAS